MPSSGQPTESPAFQLYALPLFIAYKPPLTRGIDINISGLVDSIALAIQLAPSSVWKKPLHDSGLFSLLVDNLTEARVDHDFCPPEVGNRD